MSMQLLSSLKRGILRLLFPCLLIRAPDRAAVGAAAPLALGIQSSA